LDYNIGKVAKAFIQNALGNVQISYDVFLSNFRPLPLRDGILTFSASPFPTYTVNRAK